MHLPRVQNILELPQHPGPLTAAGLGVDEHQEGAGAFGWGDLERDRWSPVFLLELLIGFVLLWVDRSN